MIILFELEFLPSLDFPKKTMLCCVTSSIQVEKGSRSSPSLLVIELVIEHYS